ncbi:MAG: methionyl-tRNA formyltransferase [Actinobacteria bacterium]|nr:methionyl-tRNA formyltransferase [Actinomycetota bacterium]
MNTVSSVLIFGDEIGVPQLLDALHSVEVLGIVAAEIRTGSHAMLKKLADKAGIPFLMQPRRASEAYCGWIDQVRGMAPDLIMVSSYSMLLGEDVLSIPPYGAINVHGALLPEYRGANPIQWALLNGERQTGVTMHYMTADLDAGDVVAQIRVPISFTDTWCDIHRRCISATAEMLAREIPAILSATNRRLPQDSSRARCYPRRTPEDGAIDWDQPSVYTYNLIRALVAPHPGAFYESDRGKVVLDSFLPISSVVHLKYSADGGSKKLEYGDYNLHPIDTRSTSGVTFEVERDGDTLGQCEISGIGADSPTAVCELAASCGDIQEAVTQSVLAFMSSELMQAPGNVS